MFKICKDIKNENLEMRQVFAKVMDDLASKDDRVVYLDADIMNSSISASKYTTLSSVLAKSCITFAKT